jgi:hypothetical protein
MPLAPPLMKAGWRVPLAEGRAVGRVGAVAVMTDRLLINRYDGSNTNPDQLQF